MTNKVLNRLLFSFEIKTINGPSKSDWLRHTGPVFRPTTTSGLLISFNSWSRSTDWSDLRRSEKSNRLIQTATKCKVNRVFPLLLFDFILTAAKRVPMNRNVRHRQPVRRDEYPSIKTQILNMCIGAVISRHGGGRST